MPTSADQDAWVEIAQGIREQVRRRVAEVGAMGPDEVKSFVEAAQAALWLGVNAEGFDKEVELNQAKLFAD